MDILIPTNILKCSFFPHLHSNYFNSTIAHLSNAPHHGLCVVSLLSYWVYVEYPQTVLEIRCIIICGIISNKDIVNRLRRTHLESADEGGHVLVESDTLEVAPSLRQAQSITI